MPSKKKNRGSPMVALRIPKELLDQIDKQIESCNRTRREEPYTRTSFILAALAERFDKYQRAKKASRKKKPMTWDELQAAAARAPGPENPTAHYAALDAAIQTWMDGKPDPDRAPE